MKAKLSIVFGSFLGALALHVVFGACGTPSASADTSCANWTTGFYLYTVPIPGGNDNLPLGQIVGTSPMPAGWEPIGTSPAYNGTSATILVSLRQCAS